MTTDNLARQIEGGDGSAELKTVNGEKLTAKMAGGFIELIDAKGGMSKVKNRRCDPIQRCDSCRRHSVDALIGHEFQLGVGPLQGHCPTVLALTTYRLPACVESIRHDLT